jgi:hypothetical protein
MSQYNQLTGFILAIMFFLQRSNLVSECLGNKVLSFLQTFFVTDTKNTEYCSTIWKLLFTYEQTPGEKSFQNNINRRQSYSTSMNVMQLKWSYNTTNHFFSSKILSHEQGEVGALHMQLFRAMPQPPQMSLEAEETKSGLDPAQRFRNILRWNKRVWN